MNIAESPSCCSEHPHLNAAVALLTFEFYFASDLQLEDDIVAKPNYFATMKNFALQLSSEDWMILEFSQLGFIGTTRLLAAHLIDMPPGLCANTARSVQTVDRRGISWINGCSDPLRVFTCYKTCRFMVKQRSQ